MKRRISPKRALVILAGLSIVALGAKTLTLASHVISTRSIRVPTTAEHSYEMISNVPGYSRWLSDVGRMEQGTGREGGRSFREIRSDRTMTIDIEQASRPQVFQLLMRDSRNEYRARWTYTIRPNPEGGATIQIREDAELASWLFRVLVHLTGVDTNVETVAAALERKLSSNESKIS